MADEETGDARRLVSTRAGVLMPERVMKIQRRPAPPPSRGRRACRRLALCTLPLAFVALQLVFAAFVSQELHQNRDESLPWQRAPPPPAPAIELAAPAEVHEPAAAEAAEVDVSHEEIDPAEPAADGAAPAHEAEAAHEHVHDSGKVVIDAEAKSLGAVHPNEVISKKEVQVINGRRYKVTRHMLNTTELLQWHFGPPTLRSEEVALHGCLGTGTYGAALNATHIAADGTLTSAVVKVPVLRHWGFRFFQNEMHAFDALDGGSPDDLALEAGRRNIVRRLGNLTLSLAWLRARAGGADGTPPWSCLNGTDLAEFARRAISDVLPALVLEQLPRGSVFQWLGQLSMNESRASSDGSVSRREQEMYFKALLKRIREPASRYREPTNAAFDVLIGLAWGMRRMQGLNVVHRDLVEPGKNVLLKRDGRGLTAALIDFSQAEACVTGRNGAGARAVDMFSFGNVLHFACYGRVIRSVPWTRFSCADPKPGLRELSAQHNNRLTLDGMVGDDFNRCSTKLQPQLTSLMEYVWQPALDAADGKPSANHSWAEVIDRLHAMRAERRPLFRFM